MWFECDTYHGEFVGEEEGNLVASFGAVAFRVEEHEEGLHDQPDGVDISAFLDTVRVGIFVFAVGGLADAVAS